MTPLRLRAHAALAGFLSLLALGLGAAFSSSPPPRSLLVGQLRVSVLSARILRIETMAAGQTPFEDRPSITFINRTALPVPVYSHSTPTGGGLLLSTGELELRYDGGRDLGCSHLNVTIQAPSPNPAASRRTPLPQLWCPGSDDEHLAYPGTDPRGGTIPGGYEPTPDQKLDTWKDITRGPPGNLNGSLDTMDCYVMAEACIGVYQGRMQKGLFSREGWAVVDDSKTALFDSDETWRWRQERPSGAGRDWYLLAFGKDYRGGLQEFTALAGSVPMMPWRAYGVWFSRYWPYNETGVKQLIADHESNALALNMLILDVDWHERGDAVKGCGPIIAPGMTSQCNSGYGGYNWNKTLFPDPPAFLNWLHTEKNLELCLNLHSQCGIDKCQQNYIAAALAVGMDPASESAVGCRIFDKKYVEALYRNILEAGERSGVDYWWEDYGIDFDANPLGRQSHIIDCKNASRAHCMHCVEDDATQFPALWSAYVRHSRKTQKGRRGMVLEYYGGLGHHRYPLVGSGDTYEAWETLSFEVMLSITAANVLVAWTHDLGGFMSNIPGSNNDFNGKQHDDPELYLRWLQFGAWSSVFRVHCSHCEPRAWVYPNSELLFKAYQLRNALVPYIYTAAWKSSRTGVLLLHPLYYDWPDEELAYSLSTYRGPNSTLQYSFGDDFVVAPVTTKVSPDTGLATWQIWVPPGSWVDWDNGELLTGPRLRAREYGLQETPVLVRAGAVVPMKSFADSKVSSPTTLVLAIPWVVGVSGTGELYEDDGGDFGTTYGRFRLVRLQQNTTENATTRISITPAGGVGFKSEAAKRIYVVRVRNAPKAVSAVQSPQWNQGLEHWYEDEDQLRTLVVQTPSIIATTALSLVIKF